MSELEAPMIAKAADAKDADTNVESAVAVSTDLEITDEKLFKMNKIGMWLHFAQGSLMFLTFLAVSRVREFSRGITYQYVSFDSVTRNFYQVNATAFNFHIGIMPALFLYLSAAAHAYILYYNRNGYIAGLAKNINRMRWWEYSISSSIMIAMIAILFGVWDLGQLVAMVGCNFAMNLFGLWMEEVNDLSDLTTPVNWTPFWLGCVTGAIPWFQVMLAFLGAADYENIPGFVYGLLIGYFIFFNTFPVNMYLQYARYGAWKDYRVGEVVYIWLSLLSKSLLAWLVFGGTMQPNGDDE